MRLAVPDGASSLRSWCSSMISHSGMCCAASAAKRIISTAPIAKFGATRTLAALAVAPGILGRGAQVVEVEARGPDDRVGAGVEAGPDVRRGGLGGGEVDDDVGSVEQVGERRERRVGPPGELEVVGTVDGLADGLPILPAAPETTTADHLARASAPTASRSLTWPAAARKQSSSAPTQAAARRAGS